jgi:ABC-2 type transport system ATP-binding protein
MNIAYFAALQGLRGAQASRRIDELLALMDLAGDAKRPVRGFSGGMRKRLSLAIALAHSPDLLLLDEPTVGLDPRLRLRMWERFHALASEGAAVLVTTHVMDEAERCDRLVLVFEGKAIASGKPDELRSSRGVSSLEQLFLEPRPGQGAAE